MVQSSQSKKRNARLPNPDELVQALFKQTSEGIFVIAHEGKILDANPRCCQILAYPQKTLLKHSFYDLFPHDEQERIMDQNLQPGEIWSNETALIHRDGHQIPVNISFQKLSDSRLLCTIHDTTTYKQAEQKFIDIFDNAVEGIFQSTPRGRFMRVNPAMARIFGYESPEDMMKTVTDIARQIHTNSKQRQQFMQALQKDGIVENFVGENYQKDGNVIWTSTNARVVRDPNGRIAYYEGFVQDITDRKQAEAALRASEDLHRTLLRTATSGFWLADLQGRLLEVNDAYCQMSGYTEEELLSMHAFDLDVNETYEDTAVHAQKIKEQGADHFETRHRRKDGTLFDVEISVQYQPVDGGRIVAFLRDITEPRRAEEVLRLQALVLEQIQDCVTITDLDGQITYVNEAECNLLKRSRDELVGQSVLVYGDDPSRGATQKDIIETTLSQGEWRGEVINFTANGTEIVLDSRTQLVLDTAGKPIAMCGIATDITERKKMERELLASETRYRTLFEQSPDGIVILNPDTTQPIEFNDQACQQLGYTREEFGQLSLKDIEAVESIEESLVHIQTIMRAGRENFDTQQRTKQGEVRDIHVTAQLIDVGGHAVYHCIWRDITERKRVTQALQASEEKYRTLFRNSALAIGLRTVDGKYIEFNDSYCRMLGYTHEELRSLKTLDITHPDDRHISQSNMQAIADGKSDLQRYEKRYIHKNGNITWGDVSIQPLKSAEGEIVGILGTVVDITDRKKAESELRKSQERLESIFRAAPIGIGVVVNRILTDVNERLCDMVGYSWSELVNHSARILYPTDQDFEYVGQEKYRQIAEKGTGTVETRWQRKDGTIINILLSSTPIEHTDLSRGVTFTALDITERKRVETALLESEERYRTLVETADDVIIMTDLKGRHIYRNNAYYTSLGFDAGEHVDLDGLARVHPDDISTVRAGMDELLQKGEAGGEYRVQHKDGRWLYRYNKSKIIRNNDGQAQAILSIIRDITERKQMEQDLFASAEIYRRISSIMSDIAYSCANGTNGYQITWLSGAVEKITGYSVDELEGMHCWGNLVIEEDLHLFKEFVIHLTPGSTGNCNLRIRCKDGSIRWVSSHAECIQEDSCYRLYGGLVDITERKITDDALKENEVKYRTILERFAEGFALIDEQGHVVEWNQAMEQISELKHDEVIGKPYWDVQYRFLRPERRTDEMYDRLRTKILEGLIKGVASIFSKPFEATIQTPSGEQKNIQQTAFPVQLGEKHFVATLVQDITERKRMENERDIAFAKYQTLFETFPLGISVTDEQGRILETNQAAEKLLAVPQEEHLRRYINSPAWRIIREDGTPMLPEEFASVRALREKRLTENMRMGILKPDQTVTWINVTAAPLPVPGYGVVITYADISAQLQAEQALRENNQFVNSLLHAIPVAVFFKDKDGKYLGCNDVFTEIMGVPAETLKGKTVFELWPGELAQTYHEKDLELMRNRQHQSYEFQVKDKDGRLRPVIYAKDVFLDASGEPAGMVGAFLDITERKQAEEALRASEERYRSLFTRSLDGIYRSTHAGKFVEVNPGMVKMFGYSSREEILAVDIKRELYFDPDERGSHILDNGKQGIETYRMRRKDGTGIWVEDHGYYVHDEQGNIIFHEGILRDVTERIQAEEALRASEEKYRALFDQSMEGIYLHDLEGRVLDVNEMACTQSGYSRDEWLGLTVFDGLSHESTTNLPKAEILQAWKHWAAGQRFTYEGEHQRKDGTIYPVEVSTGIIRYGNENVMLATVKDITERRQAEEMLRESEERYRQIVQASPLGIHIYELDSDGRLIFSGCNPAADSILGVEHAQFVGLTIEEAFPPLANTEVPKHYQRAAREGIPWQTEEIQYEHGQIQGAYQVYAFQTGKNRVTVMFLDITERKRADEAQRAAEARYRILVEQIPAVTYIDQPDGSGISSFVSPQIEHLLGISAEEWMQGDIAYWTGFIHPEDRERVLAAYERTMETGRVFNEEYRLVLPDSRTLWIDDHAVLLRDADGKPNSLQGLMFDITERKRSEQAIQRQADELEALFTVSSALRSARSTDEMLPIVLKEMRRILNADAGAVILLDHDRSHFTITLSDGILTANTGRKFMSTEGISARVLANREPVVTDDILEVPERLPGVVGEEFIGPEAIVPLMSEAEILGVLLAERTRDKPSFSQKEVRLLSALGEMIGNTMRRTILYDQALDRQERLQSLHNIDVAISSSVDLRVTLDVLLSEVTTHLKVDAADVLLFNPQTYLLEFKAGRGLSTKGADRIRIGEGIAGQIASERRPKGLASIPDSKDQFTNRKSVDNNNFVTYYGAPMIAKGQIFGVLEIFHGLPMSITPEWVEFLEAVAAQAAIAIDNAQMFEGLQHANFDLSLAYDATIEGWSRALDLRDKETEGHSQRVTEITVQLARDLNVNAENLIHIRRGALLHDIGKMGISDSILLKAGPLTEEEWEVMRKHPEYAYNLIYPISYLRPALDIPLYHHERWDGSGYPRGLQEEKIPLAARIFAVVDVWDALTSDRPYRAAWSQEKAREYIKEQSGKEFDPQVVSAFLRKQHIFNGSYSP